MKTQFQFNKKWLTAEWTTFFQRESRVGAVAKLVMFALLVLMSVLTVLRNLHSQWVLALVAVVVLICENVVKIFRIKEFKRKIPCYVVDFSILSMLTMMGSGINLSIIYLLVLTEFYLSAPSLRECMWVVALVCTVHTLSILLGNLLVSQSMQITVVFSQVITDIIYFAFHFLAINFVLFNYRNTIEMKKKNDELDAKNRVLAEMNAQLEEVTSLRERERLSRSIHDNAGHSLTVVILQTENAKLALDGGQIGEARNLLASASLNAKTALEAIRRTVHASSSASVKSLRSEVVAIIENVAQGDILKFRYDVDEIFLSEPLCRCLTSAIKEGISNGVRHGRATAFYLEIKESADGINCLLSDNGVGVSAGDLREGFGLSGLRKSVAAFSGSVEIYSEEDEGFELKIHVPPIKNIAEKEGERI